MNTKLTQRDFDVVAAAWRTFIDGASPEKVQALFQFATPNQPTQYQTFASFDLATTIPQLLSTVGIRQVMARFVLLPNDTLAGTPRFRIVLYAADERGGRISAYYQGDSNYHVLPLTEVTAPQEPAEPQGLVPFSLIRTWLKAWAKAATEEQLNPAQFATSYGPLQGYNFELGDFMNQLFTARASLTQAGATRLRLNFGLKSYFPAYPEALTTPVQTFGLVVRLLRPNNEADGADGGTESGPSYDIAVSYPPG